MMQLLIALLFLGTMPHVQSPETEQPPQVEKMCGKLVSITYIEEKGTIPNSSRQVVTPIAHARIQLFAPEIKSDCCGSAPPLAVIQTRGDGSFEFKKMDAGDYRLVASINGAEYETVVRYVPDKKSTTKCSDLLYEFEKGKLRFARSMTVTVS